MFRNIARVMSRYRTVASPDNSCSESKLTPSGFDGRLKLYLTLFASSPTSVSASHALTVSCSASPSKYRAAPQAPFESRYCDRETDYTRRSSEARYMSVSSGSAPYLQRQRTARSCRVSDGASAGECIMFSARLT